MKRCVLCKSAARIYCDSDRATLCWTCDENVHSANFLVARHSRSLLCQICQSPTPWTASGKKLSPSTASVCERCVIERVSDEGEIEEGVGGCNGEIRNVDGDDSHSKPEDSVDENDNDGEFSSTPLPPAASFSTSGEVLACNGGSVLLKRKRNSHEDEHDSSSVNINHHTPSAEETTSVRSTVLRSVRTVGNMNKIGHRNSMSGELVHAPVGRRGKSRRIAEFDLNVSAVEEA